MELFFYYVISLSKIFQTSNGPECFLVGSNMDNSSDNFQYSDHSCLTEAIKDVVFLYIFHCILY